MVEAAGSAACSAAAVHHKLTRLQQAACIRQVVYISGQRKGLEGEEGGGSHHCWDTLCKDAER